MAMYREIERKRAVELMKHSHVFSIFQADKGGGKFGSHEYDFVLVDGRNNLFPPLLDENDLSLKKIRL